MKPSAVFILSLFGSLCDTTLAVQSGWSKPVPEVFAQIQTVQDTFAHLQAGFLNMLTPEGWVKASAPQLPAQQVSTLSGEAGSDAWLTQSLPRGAREDSTFSISTTSSSVPLPTKDQVRMVQQHVAFLRAVTLGRVAQTQSQLSA